MSDFTNLKNAMITVKYIPNIFNNEGRITKDLSYSRAKSIKEYLAEAGIDATNCKVIVSGAKAKSLNNPVDNFDDIIVTPDVKDPVSIGAALYAIASAVVSFALAHPFIFWGMVLSTAYSVYQYLTMPAVPSFNLGGNGLEEGSPTYDIDGVQTSQNPGSPLAVIYGSHKFGGKRLNEFITTDGDDVFYNVLLGIGEGEIDSVSDIFLNNNPIANFTGISTTTKTGTNTQTVVPNFEDTHDLNLVNTELEKDSAYVYTTTGEDIEAFEIHFRLPSGLFQQESGGQLKSWSVTYKVEYKLHAEEQYTDLGSTTITAKCRTILRRVYRKDGLAAGKYDIRVTKTSNNSSLDPLQTGDFYLYQVDEITTDDLRYPNTALLAIENISARQLSGASPNITFTVKGKKVRIPKIMNGAEEVDWEDYYWDDTNEKWKLLDGDTELTWDGSTYVERWCANPIWCLRDFIINTRYGLGEYITTSHLNDTKLLEMAKHCEEKVDDGASGYEKRYRLDVVLDSRTKALDVITQLCASFNAFSVFSAGGIFFAIDKVDTPVYQFGHGNIIEGSFSQTWKSLKECYNWINVSYLDQDKDYAQETITVVNEASIITNGDPIRQRDIRIYTTKTSYAVRAARYALNVARYVDQSFTWRAGIDAIACQPMDLVYLAHDFIKNGSGVSGRVQTGSTTTLVKLDQSVTLEEGETYKIQVRFADDTIEEKTISDSAGTYTQVNVSSAFSSTPAAFDTYILGKTDYVKKTVRITSIERFNDDEVTIKAIEYDSNVYDDTAPDIPTSNYSAPTAGIPAVTNVSLTEGVGVNDDGTIESIIQVWWQKPEREDYNYLNRWKGVNVYLSDDGGSTYDFAGFSEGVSFAIKGDLVVGNTYYIKATSVAWNGEETAVSGAPSANITLAGKTSYPSDVSNFANSFDKTCVLTWDKASDYDLAGYEIRTEDADWGEDDSELLFRGYAHRFEYTPSSRTPGTLYIKAYNTSGVYSETAASTTPTNSAPSAPTISAVVFFNIARISWTNLADTDIVHYNVYKSATNAWAGEESLIAQITGTEVVLSGNKPANGVADSATADTITDADLAGAGENYYVGDRLIMTSGDAQGNERTITAYNNSTGAITVDSNFSTTPSASDTYIIVDRFYIKVCAVDGFGEGTKSAASTVTLEYVTEEMLGDNVVLARKIYAGEIITLAAQIKDGVITNAKIDSLAANKITGGTIESQTLILGSGGIFRSSNYVEDEAGFRLDATSGLEVNDGIIKANIGGGYIGNFSTGDGSDGDVTLTSNTTYTNKIKQFKNLTINAGVTLTIDNSIIFVSKTLTVKGTISANGKGYAGGAERQDDPGDGNDGDGLDDVYNDDNVDDFGIYAGAGGGGGGGMFKTPTTATGGAGGRCSGAGGAGGVGNSNGSGGSSGSFPSQFSSFLNILQLMKCKGAGGGGGAAISMYDGGAGGAGGGVIIIMCRTLDIQTGSTITANGNDGASEDAGGGGGGGGLIFIQYKTLIANNGTQTVNGGSGGSGTDINGGDGGAGGTGQSIIRQFPD